MTDKAGHGTRMGKSKRKASNLKTDQGPNYEPTPGEAALAKAFLERPQDRRPAPRVKIVPKGNNRVQIRPDHPDPAFWALLFQAALGTTSSNLAGVLTDQLLNALRPDRDAPIDEDLANAALAAMGAIAPRDEMEAMLASQMVATHTAAMDMIGRTRRAKYQQTLQDSGNLAIKLLRTYTAQLGALQRYRGKGQQKVTVEHVHVHKGGQAIVGNVEAGTQGAGASSKTEEQSDAKQLAHAPEPTLRCEDEKRETVPVPGVNGKSRCRMHGGTNPGAPPGNQNAFKHGHYSARAIAERRLLRSLLRETRDLIEALGAD